MCSVQEEETEIPVRKEKSSPGKLCMKCKEEKAVLITRVNDAFCRACFMVYVTHKFRAAIGKSKLIRDGEQVLVGYSGGQSSSCLLHLIQEGLSERAHKKLRFQPALLFIDEGAVTDMPHEERRRIHEKIVQLMEGTGYSYHVRSLEQAMELDIIDKKTGESDGQTEPRVPELHANESSSPVFYPELEQKLKSLLNSLKTLSAKEEMIRQLRQCLMTSVARQHNYSKIMVGDCSTHLAVRLLSDIAQGRGAHVSMETTFADRRHGDLITVRPIRDFSSKEVAIYNKLCNVETIFIPTLTTKTQEGSTIEHLTEAFVTGLQTDYLSTVSNIIRTGEKLSTDVSKEQNCALCQAPLDTDVSVSSALNAVEFSMQVSRKKTETTKVKEDSSCCGEGDGSCHSQTDCINRKDIDSELCYGCRLIVNDLDDINELPPYLLKEISWRSRRSKMKSDIQQYLL